MIRLKGLSLCSSHKGKTAGSDDGDDNGLRRILSVLVARVERKPVRHC